MVDLCLFLWLSIWGNFLPTVSLNVSIVKTVRGAAISLPGWENGLSLDCTLLDSMTGHLCTLLSSETVKHYMMDCLDFYKVFRAAESFVPPSGEHPEHRSSASVCLVIASTFFGWRKKEKHGQVSSPSQGLHRLTDNLSGSCLYLLAVFSLSSWPECLWTDTQRKSTWEHAENMPS